MSRRIKIGDRVRFVPSFDSRTKGYAYPFWGNGNPIGNMIPIGYVGVVTAIEKDPGTGLDTFWVDGKKVGFWSFDFRHADVSDSFFDTFYDFSLKIERASNSFSMFLFKAGQTKTTEAMTKQLRQFKKDFIDIRSALGKIEAKKENEKKAIMYLDEAVKYLIQEAKLEDPNNIGHYDDEKYQLSCELSGKSGDALSMADREARK